MRDKIAYLDLEVSTKNYKIKDIGVLIDDVKQEQVSIQNLKELFVSQKPNFICGHNFVKFDKKYLSKSSFKRFVQRAPIIDTLYLSLLLFPDKTTHKLEKSYKIHRESPANSPLQDCKNTKNLFIYLNECFENLPQNLQDIFTLLLSDNEYFKGYFSYRALLGAKMSNQSLLALIKEEFGFEKEQFDEFLHTPLEFAFVLSFIYIYALENRATRYFSTYILTNYPNCVKILKSLRSDNNIDIESFVKDEYRDFNNFKKFQRLKSQRLFDDSNKITQHDEISQKDIIKSALDGESFLAILPTGGGKTLTFWIPALIRAKQYKSLTVVISPLQALMQNHIESFKKNIKNQNFCIEAISGFLNPIERSGVFEKLTNGEVDILYLAPEALRSESIFKALQKRHIERFVIDEAHCFSMWGHNFRQDYRFIAQTIKELESSPYQEKIAISCFTATAKPEVIDSIKKYFEENLGRTDLKEFIASSERENLSYEVIKVENEEQKKEELWQILLKRQKELKGEENPTIIYIPQNATLCKKLWIWLKEKIDKSKLNLVVEPFYAKLDDDVREDKKQRRTKAEILQDFMDNKVDIIIATTAFGMGIDKPNITTIIHYQLSDSLESYIQESGRGARGKGKKAKCFILYDKKDIDKNFTQIRQSNLDFGEIKSLVRVLKNEYRKQKRNPIYISLKHLHKKLGKNEDKFDPTLIKTALLEIEKADIIQRKRVKTQIYATSLKIKDGKDKMETVHKILDPQKKSLKLKSNEELSSDDREFLDLYRAMILIVQHIIQRSRENSVISLDELDEIVGGIGEIQIVQALKILEENEILGNENDILLFIDSSKVRKKMENFFDFEERFFEDIKEYIQIGQNINLSKFNNKELKNLVAYSTSQNPLYMLQFIIKSWGYLLKLAQVPFKSDFKNLPLVTLSCKEIDKLDKAITSRKKIALFIIDEIAKKIAEEHKDDKSKGVELYVPFLKIYDSLKEKELKFSQNEFNSVLSMMNEVLDMDFNIRAGRLIYHQKECIEFNLEKLNERIPYRREDYDKSFKIFMEQKIANIHIFQAFLDNFVRSGQSRAKAFMRDYFSLSKRDFIKAYKIDEKFIKSPISKDLLEKIIKDLNETQRKILEDKSSAIMILAGPGSGKTKTLVHKMAHLLTKEGKKSENFLMLAHSRVAVLEFRNRLYKLLGEQALGVKILTFHSFALSLLGERIKDDKELEGKITQATQALKNNEINLPYIEMLVLDEYQDVNEDCYEFIKAIYAKMSGEKQIIAVGDDDQLIGEFFGADKRFIEHFEQDFGVQDDGQKSFSTHTLSINYRSAAKIIDFTNAYRRKFLESKLKEYDLQVNPKNKQEGFISLTQHKFNLSLKEMASEIQKILIKEEKKSIAVLLRNNDEVLAMRYWLEKLGIKAKCILEREKFKAGNLIELWECLQHLKDGLDKGEAYNKICQKYKKSKNLGFFENAFRLFEKEYNNNLTYTNFKNFLQELSFDELETEDLKYENKVIISTMHKAKGKEFDIVFVGVKNDFKFDEPAEKRLLYVAFSRAKQQLFIHTQRDDLKCLSHHFSEYKICDTKEVAPQNICYEMGLKDIHLSQTNLENLSIMAGDMCEVQDGDDIELLYTGKSAQGERVERKYICMLSKKLTQTLRKKISQGYTLEKQARVKYIVKWRDKTGEMTTQVLCEIYLEKKLN